MSHFNHHIDIVNYCVYFTNIVAYNRRNQHRDIYAAPDLYHRANIIADFWNAFRDFIYSPGYTQHSSSADNGGSR